MLPRGGVVPEGRAAQRARLAVRAPDGAVGPAQGLPEGREYARAQLVGLEARRDVVGDRLLGQQQPVRVARVGARIARVLEHALEHLRHPRRVRREDRVRAEPLDEGGEVAGTHGADRGDERQLRVGHPHERHRLACGNRLGALPGVDHDVPAAPRERRREGVGALDRMGVHRPAGARQGVEDLGPARGPDIDEQGPEAAIWRHLYLIGFPRDRFTAAQAASSPQPARSATTSRTPPSCTRCCRPTVKPSRRF